MIYLDHAATTPLRKEALDAMMPFFTEKAANASALYAAGRQTRSAIDAARRQIAQAIGAHEREIYFTAGGSEADNWALFGIARTMKEKRHIITTQIEHHAVLNSCAALEQMGYPVTYIEPDEYGFISPEKVKAAMRPNTGLVSVMTANNEVGTIEPIAEIAKIAHENGALIHTDAVQAVGHVPIDVEKLGVDLLSMAAHKFYGPKGIGALYIKNGVHITSLIYGGEQEKGLRAGTENTPAIVGMGQALRLACENMTTENARLEALRNRFEEDILSRIPHARINGMRNQSFARYIACDFSECRYEYALDAAGFGRHCGVGRQCVRCRCDGAVACDSGDARSRGRGCALFARYGKYTRGYSKNRRCAVPHFELKESFHDLWQ